MPQGVQKVSATSFPSSHLLWGLVFWWNSGRSTGYPPHWSHMLKISLMSDVSQVRSGRESVEQSESFIEQEAISAIVDLTEPLGWSLSEEGMERVLIITGAKGGVVRVFFDDETRWFKTVQRGEQEQ